MTEQQREAFEAWYNDEYVRPIIPADRTEGGYQNPDAQAAWGAWQAALSHAEGEAVTFMRTWKSEPIYTCNKPGDMSGTYYLTPQVVFSDTQEEIEARLADQLENSCPYCRGSGHKDDVAAPQVAVPEGWLIRQQDGRITVQHPDIGGYCTSGNEEDSSSIAPVILYHLATAILAAPTAPAGEPEFYVEHKTLRSAMAYVGIAAPESDEELGAEMERHTKRVIRAAAKLMTQFENARNLLRAGKEGEPS